MYMTLHSQKKSRWKAWCWIVFFSLAMVGLEMAYFQKLDQDDKDDQAAIRQEALSASNRQLREAIERLGKQLPKPLTTAQKFFKWLDVVNPDWRGQIESAIRKRVFMYNMEVSPSQYEFLIELQKDDPKRVNVRPNGDAVYKPDGPVRPIVLTFSSDVFK